MLQKSFKSLIVVSVLAAFGCETRATESAPPKTATESGQDTAVELAEGHASILVKSLDHSISFPKDGAKHRAIVEGTVRVEPESSCSGEEHAHPPQEGEPPHECPQPMLLIEVRGAKLLAKTAY